MVVVFNKDLVAVEGDITTYMNHFVIHNGIMLDYKLNKDSLRWGVFDEVLQKLWRLWAMLRMQAGDNCRFSIVTDLFAADFELRFALMASAVQAHVCTWRCL